MGRPLKKSYIGNASASGQQIEGYAWTAGDSQARLSYIVKQKTNTRYVMASVDGSGVLGGGVVQLVNGPVTQAGQGNIMVTPYGAQGSGATATANLKVVTVSTTVNGDGTTGHNYTPGTFVQVIGGTSTTGAANVEIASATWNAVGVNNAGSGYSANDLLTFSFAGWSTPAVIKVNTVNGTGAIQTVSIQNGGIYTGTSLPPGPYPASSNTSVTGVNATLNVQYGVYSFGPVISGGDYTILPTNPVSFTYGGSGAGAKANLVYGISTVHVTAGGSGYEVPPAVTFSSGNGSAHTVLSGSSVGSVVVDSAGNNYTSIPTVRIAEATPTAYARKITDRIVYTFDGKQYEWLLTGQTLPGYGWAHIKSQ
jgi:hypothetical protein